MLGVDLDPRVTGGAQLLQAQKFEAAFPEAMGALWGPQLHQEDHRKQEPKEASLESTGKEVIQVQAEKASSLDRK